MEERHDKKYINNICLKMREEILQAIFHQDLIINWKEHFLDEGALKMLKSKFISLH